MFAETGRQSSRITPERATILDPALGYATTMNIYNVTSERIEEVLEYLIRSAENVVRYQTGFVSFNFHVSADCTQIVNYGQWQNRDALGSMRQNSAIVTLMRETTQIAGSSAPTPFDLVRVIKARAAIDEDSTNLIPNDGQLTLINTYTVQPKRAEELIEFLTRATRETLRYIPGFISANLHLSFDRTKVMNYAQWIDAEATEAARQDPRVAELMRLQLEIADSFEPRPFNLRSSVSAAAVK